MSDDEDDNEGKELPEGGKIAKYSRGALQAIGGAGTFCRWCVLCNCWRLV